VFTLSPLAQGTLLGLFCDGLEQQIQYRTYFYKSSRMIREVLSMLFRCNRFTGLATHCVSCVSCVS
jgi:hypothetical protein